jgi:hypothetical protein
MKYGTPKKFMREPMAYAKPYDGPDLGDVREERNDAGAEPCVG